MVCLTKIFPTKFEANDYLVLEVQRQGIRKKYGYILTKTVSVLP